MEWSRARTRAVFVFGVAILAYAGSVRSGFVFDDRSVISENAVVQGIVPLHDLPLRDWFGLPAARTIGSYRPIATAAFWLDWRVSAGNPHYFHALNVLLHGLCMALVYLVFRGIAGEGVALVAALLASVLAASSEVVEGAIGRADLFEAIAIIAGLWAHRRVGAKWGALAALCLGVAVGSKESGVLAVVAWGLLDVIVPAPSASIRRARWVAYAGVTAAYLAFRHAALGTLQLPSTSNFYNPLVGVGIVGRVFGAAHIFMARYALGILDPRRRLYDCSNAACTASGPDDPTAWLGLVVAVALVVLPVVLWKREPIAAMGLGWFACFFLPISNLIVPATLSYGERLLYIPCIGLCLLVGWVLHTLGGPARVVGIGVVGLIALLNVVSLQFRHLDWREPATLYRSGMRYASDSATVLEQNAAMSNQDGQFREAEGLARRSIAFVPDRPFALSDLGVALDGEGRTTEAETAFQKAVAVTPSADVAAEHVTFLARHGRFAEATDVVDRYVRLWPESPSLLSLQQRVHSASTRREP